MPRRRLGRIVAMTASGLVLAVPAAAHVAANLAAAGRHAASLAADPAAGVLIYPTAHLVPTPHSANPSYGYTPRQIRAAYFLNPLLRAGIDGRGQSVAIVDSFGSPTLRSDLAVFDRTFRLPAARLLIVRPAGRVPAFNPANADMQAWALETTLDVEWVHVMAPRARIVLAETPISENEGTSGFPQIVTAEKYLLKHRLAGVISQSFGATEQTFPSGRALFALRGAYLEAARPRDNVTVLGASGDQGATDYESNMASFYPYRVTSWPASDPLVTSVGGTTLQLDRFGRRTRADRVWNDGGASASGGGRSIFFPRPSFQNGVVTVVHGRRGVPDISMSASCSGPVDIYATFPAGPAGWATACGTSEATPLLAGVLTLTDQVAGHPLGPINGYLYQLAAAHDRAIVDIVTGNNSVSFEQGGHTIAVPGWSAGPGYDLASGIGTINAHWFVLDLAALVHRTAVVAAVRQPATGTAAGAPARLGYSLWYRSGIAPTSWYSLTRSAR